MMPDDAVPRIEFLILADRAEISGGKLYMMGGCWDRVQLPTGIDPAAVLGAGFAMRVLVALDDMGPRTIRLRAVGPGEPTVTPNQFQFARSAPPPAGQPGPLAVLIASECFFGIKEAGVHRLEASIEGGNTVETQFLVVTVETAPVAIT